MNLHELETWIADQDLVNYPEEAILDAYAMGLEDAAKVCDERTRVLIGGIGAHAVASAAAAIRAAIRALKESKG